LGVGQKGVTRPGEEGEKIAADTNASSKRPLKKNTNNSWDRVAADIKRKGEKWETSETGK